LKHITPKVNEIIQLSTTVDTAMGKVYVIIESISIQTFRNKIRTLLKILNENVNVSDVLVKKLQDGLVRITRTLKTNRRNTSSKTHDKSQSTRINRSGSEKVTDKDKDVKTYKRDNSIKGEG
jgi:hypothetical protein